MTLKMTVGDTAPALTGAVNADLTGAAVEVHIRRPNGTVISRTATVSSTTPRSSQWTMAWQVGDLTVPGTYTLEVQATFSGGRPQTFVLDESGREQSFYVREQIA